MHVRVPQLDRGSYALMPESSIQYDKSRGGKVNELVSSLFIALLTLPEAVPLKPTADLLFFSFSVPYIS